MVNTDVANGWLNATFRGETYTGPATIWAALFDDNPDNGGVEVTGPGYARVQVSFSPASGGEIENSQVFEFPPASGAWGEVKYIAFFDAQTGGDRLLPAEAMPVVDVVAGMVYRVPVGGAVVKVP